MIDAWLMAAVVGLLPGETVAVSAGVALSCLSVPASERPALMDELKESLARETPARRRLFGLLAGRVARRRPLVIVPIVHGAGPMGVFVREVWSWEWAGPGRVNARRADAPEAVLSTTPDAFADFFVPENFA